MQLDKYSLSITAEQTIACTESSMYLNIVVVLTVPWLIMWSKPGSPALNSKVYMYKTGEEVPAMLQDQYLTTIWNGLDMWSCFGLGHRLGNKV